MRETKTRSLVKTIFWRVVAVSNSFIVLNMGLTQDALKNAIMMNVSGFFIYYIFERICDKIPYGKLKE